MILTDIFFLTFRSIFFHPDGLCLYSGGTNKLKVFSWEPGRCLDSLALDWGGVADIAMAQNQLVSEGSGLSQYAIIKLIEM